jgi:hypothetical protein
VLRGTEFTSADNERVHLEIIDGAKGVIPDIAEVEEFTKNALWLEHGQLTPLLEPGTFEIQVPKRYQRKSVVDQRNVIPDKVKQAVFQRELAVLPAYRDADFLTPAHPLVAELLRTMRGRLFDLSFGARATYRIVTGDEAGFLFTFFLRYLDGTGRLLEERLELVFADLNCAVSIDAVADRARFLEPPIRRNLKDGDLLEARYRPHWESAMSIARLEATRRFDEHLARLRTERRELGDREWDRLQRWQKAREDYLHRKARTDTQSNLAFTEEEIRKQQAVLQRRLREIEEIKQEAEARMQAVANLAEVARDERMDALGMLLMVPEKWVT